VIFRLWAKNRSVESETRSVKQVSATKFPAQCFAILDQVNADGIVTTKRGKPVAKLLPFWNPSAHLIGVMKGKIKIKGNILSTGLRWNANR
jgi:prevent-host-death family protein